MKTAAAIFLAAFHQKAAAFHQKAVPVHGDAIPGSYIVTLKPDAGLERSLGTLFSKGALDKVGFIYGNHVGSTFKVRRAAVVPLS
jgi:hypothetical protein